MKITIPTPCKQKLQDDNFCTKCQHSIQNFSEFNQQEMKSELENNNVYCGIFHPNQLNKNLIQKTISNVMIFSAVGLMISPVNAKNPEITNYNDLGFIKQSIKKETIEIKIKVNKNDTDSSVNHFRTYRLLINNEVIEENLEVGKEYTVTFEIQKGSDLTLRLASNQNRLDISRYFPKNKIPNKINFSTTDFVIQPVIMGKIAVSK
ncbi:hypothetical protein [Empedobacter brevis]|uniref:hypothetical protein n=1 Tax=Empedobacter brevis TaxID=247 RepID=UPI00333EF626